VGEFLEGFLERHLVERQFVDGDGVGGGDFADLVGRGAVDAQSSWRGARCAGAMGSEQRGELFGLGRAHVDAVLAASSDNGFDGVVALAGPL
jgi:hypothetical protein